MLGYGCFYGAAGIPGPGCRYQRKVLGFPPEGILIAVASLSFDPVDNNLAGCGIPLKSTPSPWILSAFLSYLRPHSCSTRYLRSPFHLFCWFLLFRSKYHLSRRHYLMRVWWSIGRWRRTDYCIWVEVRSPGLEEGFPRCSSSCFYGHFRGPSPCCQETPLLHCLFGPIIQECKTGSAYHLVFW